MPYFRETREALLFGHAEDIIDDEELILLFDINNKTRSNEPIDQ